MSSPSTWTLAALDPGDAGGDGQQGRFADPIRTDEACHAAGGNRDIDRVQRDGLAIMVGDAVERDDGLTHCGSFTASSAGHSAGRLART